MSYDLYIVREDNENNPITYEEVIKLVNAHPELELRDKMEIKAPTSEVITIAGSYIYWEKRDFGVWMNYRRGKISSSYTDDDGIIKLKEIAYELNAKVLGDEGEEY